MENTICIEIVRNGNILFQKVLDHTDLTLAVNEYNKALDKKAKEGDTVRALYSGKLLCFEQKRTFQPEINYGRRKTDVG